MMLLFVLLLWVSVPAMALKKTARGSVWTGRRPATTVSFPGFEGIEGSFEQPPSPLPAATQVSALKILSFSYKVKAANRDNETVAQMSARLRMTPQTIQRVLEMSDNLEKLLLGSNLRLVHAVAMNYRGQGMSHQDLVYEGVRGLRHALSKFEPSRGCAFSTYAYPW
jgi:hypothetical protein